MPGKMTTGGNLLALGLGPDSPGTACRNHGPLDPDMVVWDSRLTPVHLQSWATVDWDSWSTPCALGRMGEWPGTAGRHRGPSDPGPSHPGELVDTTGPRTQLQVAQESCSNQQVLGSGPEYPGISC